MANCHSRNSTIDTEVPATPRQPNPLGRMLESRATTLRKIIRVSAGVSLVVLGILGLLLPILPGWVFLIPGLLILSEYFPWVKRLVHWAKEKARQHPDA